MRLLMSSLISDGFSCILIPHICRGGIATASR